MKNSRQRKQRWMFPLLLGLIAVMHSCEKNTDEGSDFVLDVPVNITAFDINGIQGDINNETGKINFTLPYGSDVTSVSPEITIPEDASISPASGKSVDLSNSITYTVVNGNIYKDYSVTAQVMNPILSFIINGTSGTINDNSNSINLTLSGEVDVTALQPEIEVSTGVTINPASGETMDFSDPVIYTVSGMDKTEEYVVTVSTPNTGLSIAYLGVASTRAGITNPDEKAAADWLFKNFQHVEYLSFQDLANGATLDYSVIWWHFDSSMDLPEIAFNSAVTSNLKNYYSEGGNLLLTTFAARYVEALGIVPPGEGPNNVFGDFLPGGGVDPNTSWGISFKTREDHPIFQGLDTYEEGKAYFLEKGTYRLNHTAWWFLPEWGGYGNAEGWRKQTGGINLASDSWDNTLDGRVAIAEFPNESSDGNVIVIAFGAYDWYNETNAAGVPSQPNSFITNIQLLTKNSLVYLGDEGQ